MPDLTTAIHTYLTTAPTSGFLEQEVTMLDHWQGSDHLLWQVACGEQQAVLKFYLDAGQARSRRQYSGQQLYAPLGLAPEPLWYDRYPEGLSRQVLVYRWVDGERLDLGDAWERVSLAQAVAQVHAGTGEEMLRFSPHPINLDFFWRILAPGSKQLQAWLLAEGHRLLASAIEHLVAQAQALVEAALPLWREAAPAPVHGDLKPENCLSSFGSVVLVDWEMFGMGDPALEVASFLHRSQAILTAAAQSEWLDTYLAGVEAPDLGERIAVYRQLLPLQDVCFLLNGARKLPAADRQAQDFRDSAVFLADTLFASLMHASAELDVQGDRNAGELLHEVKALFDINSGHGILESIA